MYAMCFASISLYLRDSEAEVFHVIIGRQTPVGMRVLSSCEVYGALAFVITIISLASHKETLFITFQSIYEIRRQMDRAAGMSEVLCVYT